MSKNSDNVIGATAYYPDHWGNAIAVNPTTNRVYVLNVSGDEAFFVFNGETNALENTVSYTELNILGIERIAVNPVTNKIYVLGFIGNVNTVAVRVIDGNTNALAASWTVGATRGGDNFVVNPTTNRVYITHGVFFEGNNIYSHLTEFDGATNSIISISPLPMVLPQNPTGLAVNPQTNRVLLNRIFFFSVFDPVDTTPPVLTTPDITAETQTQSGAVVNYSISASDNSNVTPTVNCDIPSGSVFSIGVTNVHCTAVDKSNNTSPVSTFRVTVIFFYGLVVLFDQTKANKAGNTVPIKVRLIDANGTNISSPSLVLHATSVFQLSNDASTTLGAAGNSSPDFDFRYDSSLGGYIFNLKTTGYSTGSYQLNFIAGGGPHVYNVGFQVRQ